MRDYATISKRLRRYSENCVAYKLDADFANAVTDAADAIEELLGQHEADAKEIEWLKKCVQDLPKPPRWISVEDEPPKENGRYLVRYKRDVNLGDEETVHEDEIRIMRFFVDDGWRYPIICNDHVRLVNEEVTHWMPLPEPPKEDAE